MAQSFAGQPFADGSRVRILAVLAAFVSIAACTSDRTYEVPVVQGRGTITLEYPDNAPTKVDVLFVIDSSPAMATYETQLRQTLQTVAELAADRLTGMRADLHVGVLTTDLGDGTSVTDDRVAMPGSCHGLGNGGALRRHALVDGAYLIDRYTPSTNASNYQGDLVSTLAAMTDVGDAGCDRIQPLEAIRLALDNNPHNAGFLRADAKLAIVVLAAQDDASPGDPATYRAFVQSLKEDEDDAMIAVAAPDSSARLATFANGRIASLTSEGVIDFIFNNACVPDESGSRQLVCLDPSVGAQPICATWDDGGSYPECSDGVATPCWRASEAQGQCTEGLKFEVDRGALDPPSTSNTVHVECVVQQ
jgi:hypothetical protein